MVPYGTATGTVTVNGRKRSFTGHGYHDRNWGNRPFPYGVEHWRWGRGSVDPYAVIGADLHLREEYGSATVPAFLVDGTTSGRRLIGTYDPRTVTAGETDPRPHPDPAYPRNYRHPKKAVPPAPTLPRRLPEAAPTPTGPAPVGGRAAQRRRRCRMHAEALPAPGRPRQETALSSPCGRHPRAHPAEPRCRHCRRARAG
ncbi:hypothetical protein GCM10010524_27860 [Streptomyces mexicanus]